MEQVDESQRSDRSPAQECRGPRDGEPASSADRIARLAAHIFETPIVAIFCREGSDVRCLSAIGLDEAQGAGNSSLFAHTIESGETLVIEDMSADHRFQNTPLVTSAPHLRFYASVPLFTRDDQRAGTLSIADTKPRARLSGRDLATLRAIADLAADETERQRQTKPSRDTGSAVLVAMSHDLRTPMNGVLGMSELLLATGELDERHRRRVEIIKRSGTTLLSLIDQLLDVAKLDIDDIERASDPFDLREALNQAAFDDADKGLRLDLVDRLNTHHCFLGHEAGVQKLLTCFLNNAAGFGAESTIRIVASTEAVLTDSVRVRIKAEHASIDYEAIENLLASFSTSADPNAGHLGEAGLGLALCRKLAMRMGGAIGVDRLSGDTPAFWLDLSLVPDPEANTATLASNDLVSLPPSERRGTTISAGRHVLVAEDNPDMAMLIEDLLDEAGYHATIAHDGASTLKVMEEQQFDIVLMDGHMPDMSGFETTAFIRRLPDERADIPIIALTGEALTGDRERYLSAGMDDYIAKPVDYETLINTIERCCSQRQS